ncbi:MAG: hypothetical protein JW718_01680 [Desulfovibrionaceae bacterium]|nr:hypothetical protein [Desulfovibrionaceae bacterium]
MSLEPEQIIRSIRRRRENAWNWSLQALGLALLPPAVWLHSRSLAGVALVLMAAGLFELRLPPMDQTELKALAGPLKRAMEAEKRCLAGPWSFKKRLKALGLGLGLAVLCRALWANDLAVLGLLAGLAALLVVTHKNRRDGIEP